MQQFLLKQIEAADQRMQLIQQQFIELLKQKSEPVKTPDTMDSLDRIVGVFGKMAEVRETLGGGGGSRMNGWQEVASNVGQELIKAVGPALPFMLQRPQAPRPQAQPVRPLPAPGAPTAMNQPAAPATAAAQAAAPAADPAAPDNLTEQETEQVDAASFLASKLQEFGLIVPLLTYFNDGERGLRFALWVADGYGALPMNLIKGQGKEVVLRAISNHLPELYAQLQPNWGKFDLFVDDFLTWHPNATLPDEEDEDDELDPITAVPAPVAAAPPAPPPTTPPPAKTKPAPAKKKVAVPAAKEKRK
jgi:hypothetical protein